MGKPSANKYRSRKRNKRSKVNKALALARQSVKCKAGEANDLLISMEQQKEAGTSSSLPTPTQEFSFSSSTPVDEYCAGPSMKQQTEAGTSSSLPTPTQEFSFSSSTPVDEYCAGPSMKQQTEAGTSSSLPTPTQEFSFSSSTPVDEYCAGPSNIQPPYKMKEARKFVNVAFFVKSLQDLNNHGGDGCNFSDMQISGEAKCGWNSGIHLSCNICQVTVTVWMDDFGDQPVIAQTKTPPTLAKAVPVEAPIIAQKVPAKKHNPRYRKTPAPDPHVQQHFLVSSKSNVLHQEMVYNASKQVLEPLPVIKQEIIPTEDIRNSGKDRVISSATQPVQLLIYVEPLRSVPNLDTSVNEMIVPVTPSDVLPMDSNSTPGSVPNFDASVNEMIVPDVTPPEVLPVDLNLVKKEIEEEESPSMEVVVDCIPHIVPKSETSLDPSKTSFASKLLTETGHSKDSSPIKMKPMSSTKSNSKENRKKYVASSNDTSGANNSAVSSCPISIIPQRSFQPMKSSSKTDDESQTSNGESDKIGLDLENKFNTNS
ncbi:hypothetical protein JTE90_027235 [Oedothorax gibbosus]|uniref:Uncharacterized protein n=1 Tax=Oedothorax gibbosus TaxID=931172 RepID=A0AAV6U3R9_9ARAC|nr:hypothetical protein JTE90_027235 [Oedothorax gibbosus]